LNVPNLPDVTDPNVAVVLEQIKRLQCDLKEHRQNIREAMDTSRHETREAMAAMRHDLLENIEEAKKDALVIKEAAQITQDEVFKINKFMLRAEGGYIVVIGIGSLLAYFLGVFGKIGAMIGVK
jgi:hypothetical protein